MSEQALRDLQAIVDRLGRDVWLTLDRVAFPRYFGTGSGAVKAAGVFFGRNGCACYFEDEKTEPSVRFGRPYYKAGRDA
jgi:hypothetical protein